MTATEDPNPIDTPTQAFIDATHAAYPPDTATLTVAQQHAVYDALCRLFFKATRQGSMLKTCGWRACPAGCTPARRRW